MDFDSIIHGITTMLTVKFGNHEYYGSGFYYHQYAKEPVKGSPNVFEIKEIWLVTNRHVILDPGLDNVEKVPDELNFKCRLNILLLICKMQWLLKTYYGN
jgi:hypothetical protein